jgi:PTS system nitrogen regulatory IIA component
MRLADLVAVDRIEPNLPSGDKSAVLRVLGSLLARGVDGADAKVITKVLQDRESLASTGVGDEVAIPHGRMVGLEKVVAALAVSPAGVAFEAIDGKPVRIFVAILAPEKSATDHLRALARFSKLLRDPRVRSELLRERTAAGVLRLLELEALASGG